MKKIFSLLLVFTLIFTMALPVFAGYEANAKAEAGGIAFEIPKANTSPAIDGKIEDAYKELAVTSDMLSYAWADSFERADVEAVNWKMYGCYDDKYIYVAVTCEAPADKYYNDLSQADSGNIWQQTGLQVGLAPTISTGNEFLELGYARNKDTGEELSVRWLESPYSTDDFTPEPGVGDFKVDYSSNTLTYEIKVAWTAFQDKDAKEGDKVLLGAVVARGQEDQHLHSQLGYGITGDPGKSAEGFVTLTLGAAPAVAEPEPEPVAEETPAPVEAAAPVEVTPEPAPAPSVPQTGDATMMTIAIMLLVMLVGAGIGVRMASKKRI